MKRILTSTSIALAAILLAGCSATSTSEVAIGDESILRVGALGNTTDSLNPLTTNGFADYIGVGHLYEPLVELRDGVPHLLIAESIEPNTTADEWTITLKDGPTFSNGQPVTASDVAYSLRITADPAQSPNYASFFQDVDVDGITVVDDRTLTVPFLRPRGDFVTTSLAFVSYVYPDGFTDWAEPVGSGAYVLDEYDSGERIVLSARNDYWAGAPDIQTLEIDVINDPQARINALKSGDIDFATRIDPVLAQAEAGNDAITILRGGEGDSQALGFEMNVNQAPFDNPDVRRAMKLAIDREALVDTIFLGEGFVGNDLIGLGLAGYAEDLPQREHDPDAAREIFAAAGVSEVTVRTADITPGLTRASELLATQLADVGVALNLEPVDPASYFSDFPTLLSTPFQVAYYVNRDAGAYLGSFTGSNGFFNISGFAPGGYDELLTAAQSEADDSAREVGFVEVQDLVWNDGGTIIWGYQAVLNASVPELDGVYLSQGVPHFQAATLAP